MIEGLLQQTTIPILEQTAKFGQQRHTVLAGNIANIDTPGYRTRDLSVEGFEKSLEQAIAARRRNINPQPILPKSLGQQPQSTSLSPLRWNGRSTSFPDRVAPGKSANTSGQIKDFFAPSLSKASPVNSRNLTFHDGANRSIEIESMEMVKNASLQSFAIEVMRSQMNMLETVISERVV